MTLRLLLALLVAAEALALVLPPRVRPIFVVVPNPVHGDAQRDEATAVLAASPAGARFLHEMTADDVARGLWGLAEAGTPAPVDRAVVAEAASLHHEVGALRERRRAVADQLRADAVALAGWAYR